MNIITSEFGVLAGEEGNSLISGEGTWQVVEGKIN
jgi:hypothetical protein